MTPLRVCYIQYYNLNRRLFLSCELKDKLNLKLWHKFVGHFRTLQSKRGMKQLKQPDFPLGGTLSVC